MYFGFSGSAGQIKRCALPPTTSVCQATAATIISTPAPQDIVLGTSKFFWIEGQQSIRSSPINTPSSNSFITLTAAPVSIASDATHVYWTLANGDVLRAPADTGQPRTTLATEQLDALIKVNGGMAYWLMYNRLVAKPLPP
jgi:hypothetical protein